MRRRNGLARQQARWTILFVGPAILGFIAFTLGPMVASLFISTTDWTIGASPHFTGLANYRRLFAHDPNVLPSMWATLYYTLGSVPLLCIVAFAVAMLLNAGSWAQGLFRVIYYLPTIVPVVANSMLWLWLFNPEFGLLNIILGKFGIPAQNWLFSERLAVPSLIIMSTWGFGNLAVVFLAGLQGVPRHLYEAIDVDGGGALQKFRHITLPMMTPTIFYAIVTSVIGALQVFTQAAVMTEGGPNNKTLFFAYYLYRTAFENDQMGYACALAWIIFMVIMIITLALFRSSRRWVYYEAGTA